MTTTLRLDCESHDTAADSLAAILRIPKAQMEQWMRGFDLTAHMEAHREDYLDANDTLYRQLLDALAPPPDIPHPAWTETCFFHFTRTLDPRMFSRGIPPLSDAQVDEIWRSLYMLVQGEIGMAEWDRFRKAISTDFDHHSAELYRMKVEDPELHGGPYGLLVREMAFHAHDVGNWDYLDIPELVDDIASCCADQFGIDLATVFRQSAVPCIVKFHSAKPQGDVLEATASYLYTTLRGEGVTSNACTSFDGKGIAVPRANIERVECPPGTVITLP